jgi:hypothetical protein
MKVNLKIGFFGLLTILSLTPAHAMRWYSPSTGKWFSRDPLGEAGGQNLFAMLNNDAVNKLGGCHLASPSRAGGACASRALRGW